jgi:hypothetical protein
LQGRNIEYDLNYYLSSLIYDVFAEFVSAIYLTALLDSPAVVVAFIRMAISNGKITGMKSLSFRGHICKSYLKGTRLSDYA